MNKRNMVIMERTHLTFYFVALLFAMGLFFSDGALAQTITVGETTEQLKASERGAVATYGLTETWERSTIAARTISLVRRPQPIHRAAELLLSR